MSRTTSGRTRRSRCVARQLQPGRSLPPKITIYGSPRHDDLDDTDLEDPTTAICQGNLKKITAILNGYDIDGNSVDLKEKGIDYIFDWYLSPRESFEADSLRRNDGSSIKTDLETYRESSRNYELITLENISSWNDNSVPNITDIKGRLTQLIKDDLLKTGTAGAETFDLLINEKEIVAMPYLYKNSEEADYVFCTDKTPVHFDYPKRIPRISPPESPE